jgi:hypothetical protein
VEFFSETVRALVARVTASWSVSSHLEPKIDLAHGPLHHLVLKVEGESPEATVQIENAVWH